MLIRTAILLAAIPIVTSSAIPLAAAEPAPSTPVVLQARPAAMAGEPAPDPTGNAALDWWRADHFLRADEERLRPVLALDPQKAPLPDAAIDAVLSKPCPALDLLAIGAASTYCDWGIDPRGEGPSALMPQFGCMRPLLRLSLLRARWHAEWDQAGPAVGDLLVCLRTARLFASRHPCLIDVLCAMAMERQAIAMAARLLPALPPAERLRLRDGLDTLPPAVGSADALDSELGMAQGAVDLLLKQPVAERLMPGVPADQLSDERLRALLQTYSEQIALWQAQLRKPPAERTDGPLAWAGGIAPHPLLEQLGPSLGTISRNEIQLMQNRQQLRAALAYLADGAAALAQHPDIITGKPFRVEPAADGFYLTLDDAAGGQPLVLAVGLEPVGTTNRRMQEALEPVF